MLLCPLICGKIPTISPKVVIHTTPRILTVTFGISDQLDTSCLPPFMFSMEWWARIGVTQRLNIDYLCKELFPEDTSCPVKMILRGYIFKPHVQSLLSVLTEKEKYLKSKFCKLQDDALMVFPFDLYIKSRSSHCNKCRIAKGSIVKGRIDDIGTEFTSILITDFCQRISTDLENLCVKEVKNIVPRVINWFKRYVNSLDESQFCGDSCTMEADSPQKIEGTDKRTDVLFRPPCIYIQIFSPKKTGFTPHEKYLLFFFLLLFTFILCNFSVWTIKYFQKNLKLIFCS